MLRNGKSQEIAKFWGVVFAVFTDLSPFIHDSQVLDGAFYIHRVVLSSLHYSHRVVGPEVVFCSLMASMERQVCWGGEAIFTTNDIEIWRQNERTHSIRMKQLHRHPDTAYGLGLVPTACAQPLAYPRESVCCLTPHGYVHTMWNRHVWLYHTVSMGDRPARAIWWPVLTRHTVQTSSFSATLRALVHSELLAALEM